MARAEEIAAFTIEQLVRLEARFMTIEDPLIRWVLVGFVHGFAREHLDLDIGVADVPVDHDSEFSFGYQGGEMLGEMCESVILVCTPEELAEARRRAGNDQKTNG